MLFRKGVTDRTSDEVLKAAHAALDKIRISEIMEDSTYIMPEYDQDQLDKLCGILPLRTH